MPAVVGAIAGAFVTSLAGPVIEGVIGEGVVATALGDVAGEPASSIVQLDDNPQRLD
ncbi:MAG: hypothetical protein M0015_05845 [Betaproteobacteria bacterium]|nr:hypothetical protein [Betaproteobacteria bacterium]